MLISHSEMAERLLHNIKYGPKKRGCQKPAKLQGQNGLKSVQFEIQSF